MKTVVIHGLGQNVDSWHKVCKELSIDNIELVDLISVQNNKTIDYQDLYLEVQKVCQQTGEKVNLVGLSLGGVLALNYGIDFPDKVRSLVLINVQYKMPKILLMIQNIIFKFIPKRKFGENGFTKENFINIANSVKHINFTDKLKNINCRVLVINGENDKTNYKAAKELADLIPNAKLCILENSGHESNVDNPEGLAMEIKRFYNDLNKA